MVAITKEVLWSLIEMYRVRFPRFLVHIYLIFLEFSSHIYLIYLTVISFFEVQTLSGTTSHWVMLSFLRRRSAGASGTSCYDSQHIAYLRFGNSRDV